MADDLLKEIEDVKKRVDDAAREQARVEAARDAAIADETRALDVLREEFNVCSLEEGERLLSKLQEAITTELDKIKNQLQEYGQ
jgi:hypothetical protein